MPADTLICGVCRKIYTDLNQFVLHKQQGCSEPVLQAVNEDGQAVSNLVASEESKTVVIKAEQPLLDQPVITSAVTSGIN